MNEVRWLELELSGFGVYDEMRMRFPEDLAVHVAPNESGKSTALAGLTAVVFGLPTNSDPANWGTSRYLSYSANARFSGRVRFRALDGDRYEVRREFAGHEVSLRCVEPGRERTVWSGTHNPAARKGTGSYQGHLRELVGMTSLDLFRRTFSIEQPLEGESGVAEEVAGLLAGAGGGSHHKALEYLESQVDVRTKRTGDRGVTSRNKTKDRRLEELEVRIAEVDAEIGAGREAADGLQRLQGELAEVQEELARLREDKAELDRKAAAADEWLSAQRDYSRAQERLATISGKLELAKTQAVKVEELSLPAAAEEIVVERDWSFAQGSAARMVRERRQDAAEALEEYGQFADALRAAEVERENLVPFASLGDAPEGVLAELRELGAREGRLVAARDQAKQHLNDIEAHAESARGGYEDVAGLGEAELEELRQVASRRDLGAPIGAAALLMLGLLAGWLLGLEAPYLSIPPLAGALLGWLLGGRLLWRGRSEEVRYARRKLERYQEWRGRQESKPAVDLEPYRERVREAEGELGAFEERVAPFRREYADPEAAAKEYESVRKRLDVAEESARRYARDYWKAQPSEVDVADPESVSGCWSRVGGFVRGLDRGAATVAELTHALERMADEWEALLDDASAWDRRSAARSERLQKLEQAKATLQGVLTAEDVESSEELRQRVTEVETEAVAERNRFKAICDDNPELPPHDRGSEERGRVVEIGRSYGQQASEIERSLRSLEERELELRRDMAQKQGQNPVNIAELEMRRAELQAELAELEFETDAFVLAYKHLSVASSQYQDQYLERLSELTSEYFGRFTGRQERRVAFGEQFGVQVLAEEGVWLVPQRLSQGAQDQLAIASRLAVADLVGDDVRLPLVFDDPFLNCDAERLERVRAALQEVARDRQVILLSHDERFRGWGSVVEVDYGARLAASGVD